MIVAVIDIGSNSIKSLVASRGARGELVTLRTGTVDARISAGIAQTPPRLSQTGMQRGLDAICQLLKEVEPYSPQQTVLVATSAVRDAVNGAHFRELLRDATGRDLRILSGEEEANLIGRGLMSDPALDDLCDFYVFDLGGGSLECLAFRARRAVQTVSLPLGCVRLMERCVDDPSAPFSDTSRTRVSELCREVLVKSGFTFTFPPEAGAVFTGGTITTARAILAAQVGRPVGEASERVAVDAIRALLQDIGRLPLEARRQIPGLPATRADVFPTALATVIAVAEIAGIAAFHHSFFNLRYGVAADLLVGPAY